MVVCVCRCVYTCTCTCMRTYRWVCMRVEKTNVDIRYFPQSFSACF
uniref:5930434B04Rik protein n=1 Tax=Mus musculus TaxID=10090 RepID=Q8R075_MOUSE|nr:5930434B04Rik protein [Mus musculus]